MRGRAIPTLLALELAEAGLAGFYHFGLRVRVLDAFHVEGATMPPLTALALAPWLVPWTLGLAVVLTAIALAAPLKRSRRQWILGTAVAIVGAVFTFAVVFALLPIFNPK